MEAVHFQKKQLLAQWKSSLNAVQRCAVPRSPGLRLQCTSCAARDGRHGG